MSYYDFNDHFWSASEVCVTKPKAETKKRFWEILLRSWSQMLNEGQ
jgi:hypothetical protein